MRLPSSPGYGGKSSPSASRPSLMHFTILAMAFFPCSCTVYYTMMTTAMDGRSPKTSSIGYGFDQNHRAPLPVVHRLLGRRQLPDPSLLEAVLDEPVRGPRRQHEQAPDPLSMRLGCDAFKQASAVSGIAIIGVHREARQFPGFRARIGIQLRTAHDHGVALHDAESANFHFEQLAAPLDQG